MCALQRGEPGRLLPLDFRIHSMNQSLDIAITESKRLKLPGIVRMSRHMIGADRAGELHIPQNSHDLEKIHLSFIGVYFREIMKSSADVAHMDLVYFPSLTQVLDNGEDSCGRVL